MWRDVIVATAVSAVVAMGAFDYRRYAFWRKWTRGRFWVGVALFGVVGSVGGALTVALATLLDWRPRSGAWAFNGFIYGLVAQGVVRVEPQLKDLRYLEQGRSALARAQRFAEHFLERGCELTAQGGLSALSDQALFDQARFLHGKFVAPDPQIPRSTRVRQMQELNDAATALVGGDPAGRGSLEGYCLTQIARLRLPPEMVSAPGVELVRARTGSDRGR